jgi:hypothetical protein
LAGTREKSSAEVFQHVSDRWRFSCRAAPCVGRKKMFGYPGDGINGVFGALNRAKRF